MPRPSTLLPPATLFPTRSFISSEADQPTTRTGVREQIPSIRGGADRPGMPGRGQMYRVLPPSSELRHGQLPHAAHGTSVGSTAKRPTSAATCQGIRHTPKRNSGGLRVLAFRVCSELFTRAQLREKSLQASCTFRRVLRGDGELPGPDLGIYAKVRSTRGYIFTTDQSDAGRTGIFSRRTNQTQEGLRLPGAEGPPPLSSCFATGRRRQLAAA
eukprot:7075995-Pyramimonas_sp.AAC.1